MKNWSTPKFRKYYPKWEWIIEEYMIHAIEQHVTQGSINEKLSWGMNRLPWFIASWSAFQVRRSSKPHLSVEDWIQETLTELKRCSDDL